jgi:RNA polymerase sigma-70 factor (ECF subfamily)
VTQEEFDALYAATAARLVGQLYAMTGDLGEAQDVVQEAFVKAWQRRRELTMVGSPEAWLRTVAWRLAVSRWRSARRTATAWLDRPVPGPTPEPSADHTALVHALRRIPEAQRVAIVLHHLCDLSVEDVAAEMRVPVGTVKARLSRGRAALLPFLTDHDPSEARRG